MKKVFNSIIMSFPATDFLLITSTQYKIASSLSKNDYMLQMEVFIELEVCQFQSIILANNVQKECRMATQEAVRCALYEPRGIKSLGSKYRPTFRRNSAFN